MKPKDTINELQNKRNLMDEAYSEFKIAKKIGNLEKAVESLNSTLKHAASILNLSLDVMTKEIASRNSEVVLQKESASTTKNRQYAVQLKNPDLKTIN